VLIRTAFMQPLHEPPWHFFNCTKYGLQQWFAGFETDRLWVSENFHAGYSLSWLASECEGAIRSRLSPGEADTFLATRVEEVVALWRAPEQSRPQSSAWASLAALPQEAQEVAAAGFEFVGRRPVA
jgi:hypothetical protein